MKYGATAVLLLVLAFPIASSADSAHQPQSANQTELSDGEVRKVDKEARKITIRHGPLKNLDMPAMTMVFQVKDPTVLELVKPGDKILFSAEKSGSAYFVTSMQPAK